MSSHSYTEDQLVEQPAIGLFAMLGWKVADPQPSSGVEAWHFCQRTIFAKGQSNE